LNGLRTGLGEDRIEHRRQFLDPAVRHVRIADGMRMRALVGHRGRIESTVLIDEDDRRRRTIFVGNQRRQCGVEQPPALAISCANKIYIRPLRGGHYHSDSRRYRCGLFGDTREIERGHQGGANGLYAAKVFWPIFPSVPFHSRTILSLCLIQISVLTTIANIRNSCRCSLTMATTGNNPKAASAPPEE